MNNITIQDKIIMFGDFIIPKLIWIIVFLIVLELLKMYNEDMIILKKMTIMNSFLNIFSDNIKSFKSIIFDKNHNQIFYRNINDKIIMLYAEVDREHNIIYTYIQCGHLIHDADSIIFKEESVFSNITTSMGDGYCISNSNNIDKMIEYCKDNINHEYDYNKFKNIMDKNNDYELRDMKNALISITENLRKSIDRNIESIVNEMAGIDY